jgi:hypothetical protein
MPERTTPPAADPRRGKNPGYAEDQPRDHQDARQSPTPQQPAPDEDKDAGSQPAFPSKAS